ncbi:MAG: rod shape-determining protein MreC [Patescibacteria group bacterium]
MAILSNRRTALLALLAVAVVLYHATPFSGLVRASALPLARAFAPARHLGELLGAWARGGATSQEMLDAFAERDRARALLAASQTAPEGNALSAFPRVLAQVVAVQRIGASRLLLINRGSLEGVSDNAGVATPGGAFVGKVAAVFPRASLVSLAADPKSVVAATIGSRPDIQAVARGREGFGLSLELVSQDAPLAPGDVVVTSILEENTPAGLAIGTVAAVFYAEGELFKRAELTPFVSLGALREVAVFTPLSADGGE